MLHGNESSTLQRESDVPANTDTGGRYEVPAWLKTQSRWTRPTEVLLPLEEGIGPVWSHNENRGGWYGFLHVQPFPDFLFECDHIHPSKDEAWDCAHAAVLGFMDEKVAPNDRSGA